MTDAMSTCRKYVDAMCDLLAGHNGECCRLPEGGETAAAVISKAYKSGTIVTALWRRHNGNCVLCQNWICAPSEEKAEHKCPIGRRIREVALLIHGLPLD